MTITEFLHNATKQLRRAGIGTARLDVLVLMEDALGLNRAAILTGNDNKISSKTEVELNNKVVQRSRHIPLAYIRKKVEFYGRNFYINNHVLVPRPETEDMIDLLKKLPLPDKTLVVDVGTGSGCIGITAALELPATDVVMSDIDEYALKVSTHNAKAYHVKFKIVRGDLLEKIPRADVILANLPYVPEGYKVNQATKHEPKHAIFGGKDGLSLYYRLWSQIIDMPSKPRFVITESLPAQHNDMSRLAIESGFKTLATERFVQAFKM
jgi:release factor glutamine methyltransferase